MCIDSLVDQVHVHVLVVREDVLLFHFATNWDQMLDLLCVSSNNLLFQNGSPGPILLHS